jgi:3-oxoacyl-[acyl-carrier-protein] synthase-3
MNSIKRFPLKIIGTGSFFPKKVLTNKDLYINKNIGTDKWIIENLGIKSRHKSSSEETSSYLGYMSAMNALNNSNMSINDIDIIINNTSSPDRISPSTATIIHNMLSPKKHIPSLDINAVCSGFIYNLDIASQLLNKYKNILLISTETYSRFTDYNDKNCVYFGDGAASVIITKGKSGWYQGNIFSNGKGIENFTIHHGDTFKMNGKEVYKTGIDVLPKSIKKCLNECQISINDIDYFVPHQPSYKILYETADILGIDKKKIIMNMDTRANTAGASIPTNLHKLLKNNNIKNNSKILLAAVGSGWTWGAGILNLEK